MALIEVDVWTVGLRPPNSVLAQLEELLSQAELDRANRFHFAKDRRAHIAAHGSLRQILGNYVSSSPAEICFGEVLGGVAAVVEMSRRVSSMAWA